ncbi:MAG: RNA-binding S4 domain-containing protein [Thermoanaerobaculia bacterium]
MEKESIRLDLYLDFSCLFKTRSQAKKAIELGRVKVNGQEVNPSHKVKVGDEISIKYEYGEKVVKILEVIDRNIPKQEAKKTYEILIPYPTPELMEKFKMDRILKEMWTPDKKPDKKDRKRLRKIKGNF